MIDVLRRQRGEVVLGQRSSSSSWRASPALPSPYRSSRTPRNSERPRHRARALTAREQIGAPAQLRQKLESACRSCPSTSYITAGRRVSGRASTARRARGGRWRSAGSGRDLAAIRAWAKENGHRVSDRDRVPDAVLEAYDAVH
ncbi:histone-like nucleoid-structuring protein Lsr2 [Microbacterium paraoxydans]